MIADIWLGDPWGLLGTLAALAFIALVVIAIAALLRPAGHRDDQQRPRRSPALRLLEQRYARGEISREEFLERRDVLSRRPPADEP